MNTKLTIEAKQAVKIQRQGSYIAPSGRTVEIREMLHAAVTGTTLLRPADFPDPLPIPGEAADASMTRITVTPETTLQAAVRLTTDKTTPLLLNFASAKNPGGGFLNGAVAQEESLARASGLYHCLLSQPTYYTFHRAQNNLLYSDHMILSPEVPIFADDHGRLLETPLLCGILTSPAVNTRMILRNTPEKSRLIRPTMKQRTERLLWLSAHSGYRTLVLGAWGCGVFGCDPAMVAERFADALSGPFRNCFETVVFAVYDRSKNADIRRTFEETFPV
jgi:uncharacterized protein (TIGR02452 family)